jgi:shikimate kinase
LKVTTHGGLSVISAFADGIGSAIGLDLSLDVEFLDIERKNNEAVERTLDFLNRIYGMEYNPYVRIRSRIPRSVGLKSSSALTLAVVLGYLHYFEKEPLDAPVLAAKCSRANGTSITGALDDIYCAMFGGITLTNNNKDEIVLHHTVKERDALVCYPRNFKRRTIKLDISPIRKASGSFKSLRTLVEAGFYYEAMVLNGLIIGDIIGYDHEIISYLLKSGASYASVSGKGPAMFGIFDDHDALLESEKNFPSKSYEVIRTKLSNTKATVNMN